MSRHALIFSVIVLSVLVPVAAAIAGSTTSDTGYTVDPCYKQCSGLLVNVKPKAEGQRVFKNCMSLCQGHGSVICPDGKKYPIGSKCPPAPDACSTQCAGLLTNVHPASEAERVYNNCHALCRHTGTVTCPDGSTRPVSNPKC